MSRHEAHQPGFDPDCGTCARLTVVPPTFKKLVVRRVVEHGWSVFCASSGDRVSPQWYPRRRAALLAKDAMSSTPTAHGLGDEA